MAVIRLTNGKTTEIKNEGTSQVLLSAVAEENNGIVSLNLKGSVKTPSAPEFTNMLMEYLTQGKSLLLDMAEISYIASAGLRALLTAQQFIDDSENGVNMILKNLNAEVMDVFETTGFDNILNIAL